jgi:very-short-patch-repair endonuclease
MPSGVYIRTEEHRRSIRKALNRPEVKKEMSEKRKEVMNRLEVRKRKSEVAIEFWKNPEVREKHLRTQKEAQNRPEVKEKKRQRLLNGGASYIRSFIRNPSGGELRLREIVKEFYPNFISQFPVLNYSIDIGLSEYKIAIEYDGWYHFCDQEHIDYHKKRQEEIEHLGWRFIRYNIFQKFPGKEQVKQDIESLVQLKL